MKKRYLICLATFLMLSTGCGSETASSSVSLITSAPEGTSFVGGLSLQDSGLSFDGPLPANSDVFHFTPEQIQSGVGYNASDRRELFSGKKPYFDGSVSVSIYTSPQTHISSPLGVFQVFQKADLANGMIRVGYYNYLTSFNRTEFTYASDAYFDRYYYFDGQTVKPFICWEDEHSFVCNWQSLFIPGAFADWLKDAIPLELMEPIDEVDFVKEHSAAREHFEKSLTFQRRGLASQSQ